MRTIILRDEIYKYNVCGGKGVKARDKSIINHTSLPRLQVYSRGVLAYLQSSGAVGNTLPDLVVMMQPSMSNPAI